MESKTIDDYVKENAELKAKLAQKTVDDYAKENAELKTKLAQSEQVSEILVIDTLQKLQAETKEAYQHSYYGASGGC